MGHCQHVSIQFYQNMDSGKGPKLLLCCWYLLLEYPVCFVRRCVGDLLHNLWGDVPMGTHLVVRCYWSCSLIHTAGNILPAYFEINFKAYFSIISFATKISHRYRPNDSFGNNSPTNVLSRQVNLRHWQYRHEKLHQASWQTMKI